MNFQMIYLQVMLSAFFWGANFILAGYVLVDLPPLWAAAYRFALAAALMVTITVWRREELIPPARQYASRYLLLGAVGVMGFNLLFFFAMQTSSAVNAALIMATNPLLTTLLAAIVLGERPTTRHYLALPLALVGVVVVISHGLLNQLFSLHIVRGDILMLCANLAWAMFNVLTRRFMPVHSALSNTALVMVSGAALLVIAAFVSGEHFAVPGAKASFALSGMVIGGTVLAYLFWTAGIKQLGAARTAVFLNLVPVFAMVLGVLLGQMPNVSQLVGAVLVIGSISLTMVPSRSAAAK